MALMERCFSPIWGLVSSGLKMKKAVRLCTKRFPFFLDDFLDARCFTNIKKLVEDPAVFYPTMSVLALGTAKQLGNSANLRVGNVQFCVKSQ